MMDSAQKSKNNRLEWTFLLTILLVYGHFFLEWLFHFTKPSFLTPLTLFENASVVFVAPFPTLIVSLLAIALLHLLFGSFSRDKLLPLVPAAILTVMIIILFDNFTHTILGFHIGSYSGASLFSYFIALLLLFILAYMKVSKWLASRLCSSHPGISRYVSLSLPLISVVLILAKLTELNIEEAQSFKVDLERHPNVLLLSTDGLRADRMSAFNYARETTPYIRSLVDETLFSENSFSNSVATTGSVAALLSGKLPTKTRVVHPPSIFEGVHVFQHFAGFLKQNGYRNLDVSTPHFADSYDLNLRDAFDVTTGRKNNLSRFFALLPISVKLLFVHESFFLELVSERIRSRVLHALFLVEMVDAYRLVTDIELTPLTDEQRLSKLFRFVGEADGRPFFAHVHLMETHGSKYALSAQHYSVGQKQNETFMTDFYDDAVMNFDNKVKRVVDFLKQNNLLDDTILILTTDHGVRRTPDERLPLMIRFPNAEHRGRVFYNTQRADIPPTILDYLGAEIPSWMDGDSLISGELDEKRVLYVASNAKNYKDERGFFLVSDYSPPFYSLGKLAIVQCQQVISLDLTDKNIQTSVIQGHTHPCKTEDLLTDDDAYKLIVKHLEDTHYDMSGY